jgi:replicative DNA helicase
VSEPETAVRRAVRRPPQPPAGDTPDPLVTDANAEPQAAAARRPAPAKREREEVVYDATNERVVIAAQMASREKRKVLVRSVSDEEMLVPEHAAMQRALRTLEDQQLEYDPQVFRRLVADEGVPVDEGYIASLEARASVPENLDWHVGTLRWDATRARVLRGPTPELLKLLKDPKASPDVVAAAARAVLRAVEGGGGRRFMRRPDELNRSYKAEVAARVAVGNFFPLGYEAMDRRLNEGAMRQRTALVVGLSGSGKSTFTADLVKRLAQQGRRVLLGSWEMGAESVLDVLVASMARVEIGRVVSGDLRPDEVARINKVVDWCTDRITFMDNAFFGDEIRGKGKPSNDRALDVLEGYIAESGCDAVVMDLWERCLVDLSYDGVTKALYRQQDIHKRYNVWGVIVHQLKLKEVEARADKRPTREAVKGSGAFVEVADLLFGVHRDAQFKRVPDDSLEVICLKQRKGKAFWSTRFDWDGEMGLITGGEEVPYDPGLEASREFGDVSEVAVGPSRGTKRKPSRRDG